MKKILYVEDKLSENIPRIIRLFAKYLSPSILAQLKDLDNDVSGYVATPDKIKHIVAPAEVVDMEYRFPDALQKIIEQHQSYALFIVDRNLNESEYLLKEVLAIDPDYNDKYSGREGDYLLLKLALCCNVDIINKFYFLTAYPAQDELRSGSEIAPLIDFNRFTRENFVEKSNTSEVTRLQEEVINQNKILNVQHENIRYLTILQTYSDAETAARFLNVLVEQAEAGGIEKYADDLRRLYERIIRECTNRIPKMKSEHMDNYRKTTMRLQPIEWLSLHGYIDVIRREFFLTINKIIQTLPSTHPTSLSLEVNNALIYAVKDMLLWYEGICQTFPLITS